VLLWREAPRAHRLAQIHAIDELHEQVKKRARLPMLKDGDDVRMMQFPEHARLACESLRKCRIASQLRRENFQSDSAIEGRLPRFVNEAHAALTDELFDFELREGGCDFRQRRRSATSGRLFIRFTQYAGGAEAARRVDRDGMLAGRTDFRVHVDS